MKKASEVIMDCLKAKGMSQRGLAREMGEDVRLLNQQLNRQNDMKVERFADVLEHIGYHLEVVDNETFRKATLEFADSIVESGSPKGLFYAKVGDGYIGIDSTHDEMFVEEFSDFDNCRKWLLNQPCKDANGLMHVPFPADWGIQKN